MAKKKDFFGKDITSAIEEACSSLAAAQDQLDIEVVETGSAGIFGLCRKKAHIRVSLKGDAAKEAPSSRAQKRKSDRERPPKPASPGEADAAPEGDRGAPAPVRMTEEAAEAPSTPAASAPTGKSDQGQGTAVGEGEPTPEPEPGNEAPIASMEQEKVIEPASQETLDLTRSNLVELLRLMGFPSEVVVTAEKNGVLCHVTGAHEEDIIGNEGRTLDSLQYLLRKMMSRQLPDRAILTIDVGNFRERRAEELKERALQLAEQVQADGKTQAIPALNPSERRVVHMALQESKTVRSRSVGDGLFKKVLIYKPGKPRKTDNRKRKGRHGGRSSGD